ncbi:MAG: hypothetical protein AAGG75_28090 [Bacteroidota bacterium]
MNLGLRRYEQHLLIPLIFFALYKNQHPTPMKIPEQLPIERISMSTIYRSILSSLNLEKGFFFTIREMLLRPE